MVAWWKDCVSRETHAIRFAAEEDVSVACSGQWWALSISKLCGVRFSLSIRPTPARLTLTFQSQQAAPVLLAMESEAARFFPSLS